MRPNHTPALCSLIVDAKLPPQVEAEYTSIIDNILATSDLNTISAKRIRKGLQEALHQDISQQKVHWSIWAVCS